MRERSTQVSPQKGQMLSLKPPPSGDRTGAPARVVYGEDCYIIPRNDRVVVGATVENSSTMHCDVEGVHSLLGRAQKLCPGLGAWQLDDAWAGLRPTTTDGAPVRISASRRLQYDSYHVVGRFFVDFEPFRRSSAGRGGRTSGSAAATGGMAFYLLLLPRAC